MGKRAQINAFFDEFDEYVYALAQRQNANELELLLRAFPSLLAHLSERSTLDFDGEEDWGWFSVPWAIIDNEGHYSALTGNSVRRQDSDFLIPLTPATDECLAMLERVGFKPDGHFYDRVFREGSDELILRFCDLFGITAESRGPDPENTLSAIQRARLNSRSEQIICFLQRKMQGETLPVTEDGNDG